ncbi:hypothetical protein Bbelb_163380 [Branchiostoma belcheri]|nr:hypothetical protein Bbelb_163380 [Branchiostoma belcheri]
MGKVPVELRATESACLHLPPSSAEQLRSEVAGILRTVKPPKPNITKQKREALKELKKEKDSRETKERQRWSWTEQTMKKSFRGDIYQQKFGTAMGSPVSPVLANLFMEWLEQETIATAPITCRPKIWKRYVDDVMEIVKKGVHQDLTDHLNNIDPTGSIQFTHEEEKDNTLPFLDILLVQNGDGTVKLLVYRKNTHTDRYLNFQAHHPLHQKLGVIRTLMNRCNSVVTEEEDKERETQHIKRALIRCGYPQWTFQKVEQQKKRPKTDREEQEGRGEN